MHGKGIILAAIAGSLGVAGGAKAAESAEGSQWRVPARAARRSNPVPANSTTIERGRTIYGKECAVCHGKTGRGEGPKAPDLRVNPGDFTRAATQGQSDGELFYKITRGRTPMPSYRASLSDEERWMLVHYMRELGKAGGGTDVVTKSDAEPKKDEPDTTKAAQTQVAPITKTTPPEASPKLAETATVEPEVKPAEPKAAPTTPTTSPPQSAPETSNVEYVSKADYDRLQSDHEKLKEELNALKKLVAGAVQEKEDGAAKQSESAEVQETIEGMEVELEQLRDQVNETRPGSTQFLVSGFGSAGFTGRKGGDSRFTANLAPLFLWQLTDRILFESELDFTLEENDTELDLVRAHIYYVANDYLTLGAGKFLSPMNFLEDRLHQVTKLPDKPVAISELLPETNVGIQARGGTWVAGRRFTYAFYAANAPGMEMDNAAELGELQFDNFENDGGHVALGGRIGFYPVPELEIGYGFQVSGMGAGGGDSFLHSVDFNYVHESEALRGIVNVLAQWAWSDVDEITYDSDGSLGIGPVNFENDRNGGYVQLAYRPSMARNRVLNRFEPVVRYEHFETSEGLRRFDEERWTFGLNYWLLPSAVLKGAYQFGERSDGQDVEAVMFQFKVGF